MSANVNDYDLANRIYDCISDGYDDEEQREDVVNALCNEFLQGNNEYIKLSFIALCERIEELEM